MDELKPDKNRTKKTSSLGKSSSSVPPNFIKDIIIQDIKNNKYGGRVATRFPPEPNGYLHIGHAKSICLNFGLAEEFNGTCNLRFDDTNPITEEKEYVDSIKEDIKWLGFDWGEREYYASDYFEKLYEFAVFLIKEGKAYVDSLSEEEIKEYRGDYYRKAKESPYRNRSVEENLRLFEKMRAGEFKDGECVLRAKIDMNSPNMNLRDPIMYRIRHATHHRTGDKWCIYPMYDWAHGQSDAIEGITHSICTLEFEDHRPLYDWFLQALKIENPPQQIEFARLNLSYTVMSKRKLLELVEGGYVSGWNDPRMPTLSGLRRRGYTPQSIRMFAERIGVSKAETVVDISLLEHCLREDLEIKAPRVMAVLRPLKVVIDNYPEGIMEELDCPYMPEDFRLGSRKVPFTKTLYIERDDFREDPPKSWHRLSPGKEVRLRYACLITCVDVIKDQNGEIIEVHCIMDPKSKGGVSPDGRKVPGTLHWVSADYAIEAEVRLYDRLFTVPNPLGENGDFKRFLNPKSLEILTGCKLEPSLKDAQPAAIFQFERLGYFCVDMIDSRPGRLVFNRAVTLRDTWAKIEAKMEQKETKREHKIQEEAKKFIPIPIKHEITFEEFAKVDLRVGTICQAEIVEGSNKLVKLMVDLGEGRLRQVFAGIRKAYPEPQKLIGRQVVVVANVKPRKMSFGISEGIVLTGGDTDDLFITTFDGELKPGETVT